MPRQILITSQFTVLRQGIIIYMFSNNYHIQNILYLLYNSRGHLRSTTI